MSGQSRVLVAGAGPVGVTVAYALLRQDIPVTLIEASGELPSDPRAATFHPPTMEMLEQIGLAKPLHEMGIEIKTWQYRDRKKGKVAEFDLGLLDDITPYPYRLHCEQFKYARMALEKACEFSDCDYRNNTAVTGFRQDADGVSLAGDAAHINNPLGGMGLNFGLHDAINLTEKMAKVWRGEAQDDLLDLYVRQRRTVAVEYLHAQTLQNKKDLEEKDEAVREKTQAEWRRTAEDPDLARKFLLRTAMIEGVRRAASIQ